MARILVTGATGTVGRKLVDNLLGRGERVVAASRRATAIPGAEARRFDPTGGEPLSRLFQDVDRAYLMVPSGIVEVLDHLMPLIDAAKAAGVKVVLQSVFGVDASDEIPYRKAEIALEQSGLPHVILRPNWFADNFQTYWRDDIRAGTLAVPAADGASSFIDTRDIAASAAAALTSDRFDGRAFNLTGPRAVTYAEAAAILSEVGGRPVRYTPLSDEEFIARLTGAGVPPEYAEFLAAIFHPVREGWTGVVTPDVNTLTGHDPIPLETYAKDNRAAIFG